MADDLQKTVVSQARPWMTFLMSTTFLCQCNFILARTFLAMGLPLSAPWGFVLSMSVALLLRSPAPHVTVDFPSTGG